MVWKRGGLFPAPHSLANLTLRCVWLAPSVACSCPPLACIIYLSSNVRRARAPVVQRTLAGHRAGWSSTRHTCRLAIALSTARYLSSPLLAVPTVWCAHAGRHALYLLLCPSCMTHPRDSGCEMDLSPLPTPLPLYLRPPAHTSTRSPLICIHRLSYAPARCLFLAPALSISGCCPRSPNPPSCDCCFVQTASHIPRWRAYTIGGWKESCGGGRQIEASPW